MRAKISLIADTSGKQDVLTPGTNITITNNVISATAAAPTEAGAVSGTQNKLVKFASATTQGDSNLSDDGTFISSTIDFKINGLRFGRGGGAIENNVAGGFEALQANINGGQLTAVGWGALKNNTSSNSNSAFGAEVLYNIAGGSSNNCGFGASSLYSLITGSGLVGFGTLSLLNVTAANSTVAIGFSAGRYIANKATGLTSIYNSILIGNNVSPLANGGSNEIVIAYNGIGAGSDTTTIGNSDTWKAVIHGRVSLGTTDHVNSALLNMVSTTMGFLGPRMTNIQMVSITSPPEGLQVYDLSNKKLNFFNGTNWVAVGSGGAAQPNKIIIATTVNITSSTLDANGLSQEGKTILIDNDINNINYTVTGEITASFVKGGTGTITFVQGAGRTLFAGNGTLIFDGLKYSTASIVSFGTTDIIYINNF